VGDVIEMRGDKALRRGAQLATEDHDLLDEFARSAHRGWLFAAIVALDALGILAFLVWVVVPKLT
jgi:hypothetical protein